MPQHGHRKPFSAKQKKKQLQLKREKKKARDDGRLFVKMQLLALDPIVCSILAVPAYCPKIFWCIFIIS